MAVYRYTVQLLSEFISSSSHFLFAAVNRMIFVIFKEHSAAPITVAQLDIRWGVSPRPCLCAPFLDASFSGVYYTLGNLEVIEMSQTQQ